MPYFKQGDDLNGCIEKDDNGVVDAKKTLANYEALLLHASEMVRRINDNIPEGSNVILEGNTHYIGIEGSDDIIQTLVGLELAQVDEDDEESHDGQDSCSDDDGNDGDNDSDSDGDSDNGGNDDNGSDSDN
jgi:hypothetical protein